MDNITTHIDFAWHSPITKDDFVAIEQELEEHLMRMSGFDSLEHAEMFYHTKYRIKITLVDMNID